MQYVVHQIKTMETTFILVQTVLDGLGVVIIDKVQLPHVHSMDFGKINKKLLSMSVLFLVVECT